MGLVARLQTLGLAIGNLYWQVSTDHAEKARRAATITALKNLQAEATDVTATLGMAVDYYQFIRLDGRSGVFPLPGVRMNAAVAMAPAMPPPNATPDQQNITAEASADVLLRPTTPDHKDHP